MHNQNSLILENPSFKMSAQANFENGFSSGFSALGVERDDIRSMESGWLTDTCIRKVVQLHAALNPDSRVGLVDPTWFNEWQQMNCHKPTRDPAFLYPKPGTTLAGLAIPFNEGNQHWTTIYVNLEKPGAVYMNTIRSHYSTQRAEKLMRKFYHIFQWFFQPGSGEFEFKEDLECPQQLDSLNCGIYTTQNVIDLLALEKPRRTIMTPNEIRIFRENGVRLLRAAAQVEM
jgi:hypothetical protein